MTENYYIALENPISMDFSTLLLRYMTGRACLAECLKYDPSKRTKIHLIPRPGRSGGYFHPTLQQGIITCMPGFMMLLALTHIPLPVLAVFTLQVLAVSCCQSSHSAACLLMSCRVPHAGALKQVALECSPFFCFHHVNASEDSAGNVNLDLIAMHGGVDFSMNFSNLSHEFFAKPPWRTALTRLNLSPATAEVQLPHAASRAISPDAAAFKHQ